MAKTAQDVTTGVVRMSYVHLFQPHAQNGQEPKYSATILIPKSDTATLQAIQAAISAAIANGIANSWGGAQPPKLNVPLHDGDGTRPSDGMPFGPECKDHWVLSASSKQRPEVVDQAVQPIINQIDVYSGMYARVSLRFFAYNSNGRKGIGCGLGNVQKVKDGEPLGGRTSAKEDFAPISGAAANTAPAAGYAVPWAAQPVQPQSYPDYTQQQPPQYAYPTYPQATAPQPQINPITGLPMTAPGNGSYGV